MDAGLLILAAGRGARAGGPKALKPVGGVPALIAMAEAYRRSIDGPVLAVTGPDEAAELGRAGDLVLLVNRNPDPKGAEDSVLLGLSALPSRSCFPPIFITPIDCPPPSHRTLRAMRNALVDRGVGAVIPLLNGRPGHPVLLSDGACLLYRAQPDRLDRFMERLAGLRRLDVTDPAVGRNLTTAEDWAAVEDGW